MKRSALALALLLFSAAVLLSGCACQCIRGSNDAPNIEWHPSIPVPLHTALSLPGPLRANSPCVSAYKSFFAQREIEIRLVFGYKDARPARFVGDRYERFALTHNLTKPCPVDFQACGFTQDEEDADLFTKIIPGPDGEPRKVKLWVIHSSVGPDDDENRENSFQHWQTQYAQKAFHDGILSADSVLYDGHSRDGGGPDFGPPRVLKDLHPAYYWYQIHKPGLTAMLQRLPNSRVKLLGLYSCVSTKHFSEAILESKKDLALVTSSVLLYYNDALRALMGTLGALLGQWCEPAFLTALHAEKSGGSSQLQGFFKSK